MVVTLFSGRHLMHVRRALALTLAVPLLLTGCSDDAEPTPKMPDSPTSSSTPSPTETATPEAESPEDFIRRWVEVSNRMQNTGETDEYLKISDKCGACKQVAQRVEDAFKAGGFVETDGWTILNVEDMSGGGGRPVLDVRVDSAPTVIKESADDEEVRYSGGNILYRFRLNASAPWALVQLTQVAS